MAICLHQGTYLLGVLLPEENNQLADNRNRLMLRRGNSQLLFCAVRNCSDSSKGSVPYIFTDMDRHTTSKPLMDQRLSAFWAFFTYCIKFMIICKLSMRSRKLVDLKSKRAMYVGVSGSHYSVHSCVTLQRYRTLFYC